MRMKEEYKCAHNRSSSRTWYYLHALISFLVHPLGVAYSYSCVSCPSGTYTEKEGSDSCPACARNEYSPGGATKCTPCGDNFYSGFNSFFLNFRISSRFCGLIYGKKVVFQMVASIWWVSVDAGATKCLPRAPCAESDYIIKQPGTCKRGEVLYSDCFSFYFYYRVFLAATERTRQTHFAFVAHLGPLPWRI